MKIFLVSNSSKIKTYSLNKNQFEQVKEENTEDLIKTTSFNDKNTNLNHEKPTDIQKDITETTKDITKPSKQSPLIDSFLYKNSIFLLFTDFYSKDSNKISFTIKNPIGIKIYNEKVFILNSQGQLFLNETLLYDFKLKNVICWDILDDLLILGGKEVELSLFSLTTGELLWKAKNVKHDNLDLRQPVWIHKCQFITRNKLIIGTAYGQLRLYDVENGSGDKNLSHKNRPCFDFLVGEYPIKNILKSLDNTLIYCSDTVGNFTAFDISTQTILHKYLGSCGAISDIVEFSSMPWIATVGIDRYFRMWDKHTRVLVQKIYLKFPMLNIHLDEQQVESTKRKREENDIWKNMEITNEE